MPTSHNIRQGIIADDINDLRAALGYQQVTLTGGSYGTTLALEFIRRHGEHVRAAVLSGATPPTVKQTETLAQGYGRHAWQPV